MIKDTFGMIKGTNSMIKRYFWHVLWYIDYYCII